jgi:hypothetical protein
MSATREKMEKADVTTTLEDGSTKEKPEHLEIVLPESLRNISPEEHARLEKALIRKIDLRIMPMLVLMYILNYLDRNNIAAGKFWNDR